MDSTEKIRQRWIQTLAQQSGQTELLMALANWCYYVLQTDLDIDDPRSESLLTLRHSDEPLVARLEATLQCVGISSEGTNLGEDQLNMIAERIKHIT